MSGGREVIGSLLSRVRGLLRIRRVIAVGRVRYTELTPEPLHRAISRHGGGFKEYLADFGDRGRSDSPGRTSRMRIRCTPNRVYDDLTADPRSELSSRLAAFVRPGMRVLVVGGGTGVIGAAVARLAGPSGAVVCLDADEESARFAARRYPRPNAAFEFGGPSALAGEIDGGFDGAVLIEVAPADAESRRALAREVLRVTAAEGPVVLAIRSRDPIASSIAETMADPNLAAAHGQAVQLGPAEHVGGWTIVMARRAEISAAEP